MGGRVGGGPGEREGRETGRRREMEGSRRRRVEAGLPSLRAGVSNVPISSLYARDREGGDFVQGILQPNVQLRCYV